MFRALIMVVVSVLLLTALGCGKEKMRTVLTPEQAVALIMAGQDLDSVTINGHLIFESGIPSNLRLENTTIKGGLYCSAPCTIDGYMFLAHATIEGSVYLSDAIIRGSVHLSHTTIKGTVTLTGTIVQGYVYLSDTTVDGDVDLSDLIVQRTVNSSNKIRYDLAHQATVIQGYVSLSGSNINGSVDLSNATLESYLDLENSRIGGPLNFTAKRGPSKIYADWQMAERAHRAAPLVPMVESQR